METALLTSVEVGLWFLDTKVHESQARRSISLRNASTFHRRGYNVDQDRPEQAGIDSQS